MKTADELLARAEAAVRRAQVLGAGAAEVFIQEGRTTTITDRGGYVSPAQSHSVGVGVRVALGDRVGIAGSSGLHRIEEVVQDAVGTARTAPPDPSFAGFPTPRAPQATPTPVPQAFAEPDHDLFQETLRDATRCLGDPRITFRSVTLSTGAGRFVVANSEGVAAWDQGGRQTLSVELRASDHGRDVTAWDKVSRIRPLDTTRDIAPLIEGSQDRAIRALRPRPLERNVDTVVLTDSATGQIVSRFIQAFSGSLVRSGQSRMAERMGRQVASPLVDLVDLPQGADHLPRIRVDHEGTPTAALHVVEDGVARAVFHDSRSGNGQGGSNGRGLRVAGWNGGVRAAPLFLTMRAGDRSVDEIVAETDRAVLVEEPLTGMLTANVTTGDFSAVVPYAFLVEGGEVRHALPNLTIGGNVHEMMRRIDAVGDTAIERRQGIYPAIRTRGVSCAS